LWWRILKEPMVDPEGWKTRVGDRWLKRAGYSQGEAPTLPMSHGVINETYNKPSIGSQHPILLVKRRLKIVLGSVS
jgi:hypothetical protein